MWKNNFNQPYYSLFLADKSVQKWNISLDWFLPLGGIHKLPMSHPADGTSVSRTKSPSPSAWTMDTYKIEAEEGIARIQDPLWQRVCIDILQVLGPIAFKDLWKSKLLRISPQGRKVYFSCPNQTIVDVIGKYHFVIIDAIKKFYPFLSSIEMEIRENKLEKKQRP